MYLFQVTNLKIQLLRLTMQRNVIAVITVRWDVSLGACAEVNCLRPKLLPVSGDKPPSVLSRWWLVPLAWWIAEAVRSRLRRFGGICLISDAGWVVHW